MISAMFDRPCPNDLYTRVFGPRGPWRDQLLVDFTGYTQEDFNDIMENVHNKTAAYVNNGFRCEGSVLEHGVLFAYFLEHSWRSWDNLLQTAMQDAEEDDDGGSGSEDTVNLWDQRIGLFFSESGLAPFQDASWRRDLRSFFTVVQVLTDDTFV